MKIAGINNHIFVVGETLRDKECTIATIYSPVHICSSSPFFLEPSVEGNTAFEMEGEGRPNAHDLLRPNGPTEGAIGTR